MFSRFKNWTPTGYIKNRKVLSRLKKKTPIGFIISTVFFNYFIAFCMMLIFFLTNNEFLIIPTYVGIHIGLVYYQSYIVKRNCC
jgi:uncharacterized RDD family membrane protein YckC